MEKFSENNYKNVISELKKLHSVKASEGFKNRVVAHLIPSLTPLYSIPFFSIAKLAFSTFILVALSGTGIVLASQKSQPGDLLYPVKKMSEKIQLSLTRNPTVKTLLHINNAEKRINELEKTIPKSNTDTIKNVTTDYESQVKDALHEINNIQKDKQNVSEEVNQNLEKQTQRLEDIQKIVPTTSVDDVQKAIDASKLRDKEGPEKDSPLPTLPPLEK